MADAFRLCSSSYATSRLIDFTRYTLENFRFSEFLLDVTPNQQYTGFVSSLYEGRIAIVRTWGGMRWTLMFAHDERGGGVR